MDIQKEREAFESWWEGFHNGRQIACDYVEKDNSYSVGYANAQWVAWQAKAQAVPAQLDVNSILHDIDCYFDNGLSNTERTANNLLQSIYEKLSGEVKAREPAND